MASKRPVYLEVDSNIIEQNLLLEECKTDLSEYKSFLGIDTDGKAPWTLATPQPGFCVKTKDVEGKKIFVNICILNEIPEPKDVTEEELVELIESEDASEFRVPLSMQDPHDEVDKSGKAVVCYDVAINPKFYNKVETSPVFKLFLLQITFDGLKDKFDIELNIEDYTLLKNRKSVGVLRPHRIRNTPHPYKTPKKIVEEITSSTVVSPKVLNTEKKTINSRFAETKLEGNKYLYGEIYLPSVVSMKDFTVEVGEDRLIVESKNEGVLDVYFPLVLNQEKVAAEFSKISKTLHLWIHILH